MAKSGFESNQAWSAVPEPVSPGINSKGSGASATKLEDHEVGSGMELLNKIIHPDQSETLGGSRKLWIQTTQADFFFGGWIVINAFTLALETDMRNDEHEDDTAWVVIDSIFNTVFLFEVCLRIYAERRQWAKDVWNIFDFILVAIGVLDTWILPITGMNSDMRFVTFVRLFRLLRLVRVLRVLRLLRFLKELMLLVQGITSAMRAMVWGLLLLGITIFICALLITRVVGKACCDEDDAFKNELYVDLFGTLARTSFTLFQFTMEFQPDICRDTWDHGPWLTFFFIAYTMFTNITLLNTVASVIVENILSIAQRNDEEQKEKADKLDRIAQQNRLSEIFAMVDEDGNRMIDKEEITKHNPAVEHLLQMSGVSEDYALNLFSIMDVDGSGTVSRDEFHMALMHSKAGVEATDILRIQCQLDAVKAKVGKAFEDHSKQNSTIIEALSRLEANQTTLEEKIASARQPDPSEMDAMSISFVPRYDRPVASIHPPTESPPPLFKEQMLPPGSVASESPRAMVANYQYQEETLLV